MTGPLQDRHGSATVEAALAISLVLLPLTLGMIDFGEAIAETARLDRAYDAALYYIWANPGSVTAATIQQAAQSAYGTAAPTLSVSASTACWCVSASYVKAGAATCTATCPTGQTLAAYLTLSTTAQFPLPTPFPGLASPMNLAVQGTVRTR